MISTVVGALKLVKELHKTDYVTVSQEGKTFLLKLDRVEKWTAVCEALMQGILNVC